MAIEQKNRARNADVFPGDSDISRQLQAYDWGLTALGPPENWPKALKTAVHIALTSRFSLWVGCGKDLHMVYNEAFKATTIQDKHPWAVGRPVREVWHEVWDIISPMLMGVLERGEASWLEDSLLILERKNNTPEETYFTYSYSPIKEDDGEIVGVFTTVAETTQRVIGERRLKTLRDLGAQATSKIDSPEAACQAAIAILAESGLDIPYAALFVGDDSVEGIQFCETTCPGIEFSVWPVKEVMHSGAAQLIENLQDRIKILDPHWQRPLDKMLVLPLGSESHREGSSRGVLVAGVSPLRPLDEEYRGYYNLVAGQIGTAIANAQAYEDERKRAEELEALDKAKTAFFSSISHEFRTPLTLMMGPLEDALQDPNNVSENRVRIDVAHRNARRLLKLVNTLLDFSRIEAGRVQASYQLTELSAYTMELASVFRSTVEKAGLNLKIDCPPLPEPVYIDRDMWEKIVFNLLSNAFKHTFKGEIEVKVSWAMDRVELSVRDTGIGVPSNQLSQLFERFHRVPNARSRTHEGTGIGLALVNELVKLHGGAIRVSSIVDEGSTFTVYIPAGKAHLAAERIEAKTTLASTSLSAEAFVEEALHWLPCEEDHSAYSKQDLHEIGDAWYSPNPANSGEQARVLLADDNTDMRDYVCRLLQPYCEVIAVSNGEEALKAARQHLPDLVLSDVMMPKMDGFELLNALRNDPSLQTIPVILLSARAGEEAKVGGLEAGADDYLTKPFSARELLARVKTNLGLSRVRQEAEMRYTLIVQGANEGIWDWDLLTNKTYWNDRFYEILGLSREEMPEPSSELGFSLLHPDDLSNVEEGMKAHLESRVPYNLELRMRHASGAYRYLQATAQAAWDSQGKPIRLAGAVTDITEQKKAEAEVRESEMRFRTMAESAEILISVGDETSNATYFNQSWVDLTGRSMQALLNFGWADLVHPEDRQGYLDTYLHAFEKRVPFTGEFRILNKEGQYRWLLAKGPPRFRPDGSFAGYIASCIDITDRKRTEEALKESEERFRTMADASPTMIWMLDAQLKVVYFNKTLLDFKGLTMEEALEIGWEPAVHPDDLAFVQKTLTNALNSREHYTLESRSRRADGEYRWLFSASAPRFNAQGEFMGYVGSSVDMTDRKQEEARKAAILESSLDAILTIDQHGTVCEWNAAAERIFGYTKNQAIDKSMAQLIIPERYREAHDKGIAHYLATGEGPVMDQLLEMPALRADGSEFLAELNITRTPMEGPPMFTGTLRDITERKNAENILQKSFERERLTRRVSELSNKGLDIDTILNIIAEEVGAFFQADRAFVAHLEQVDGKYNINMIAQYCRSQEIASYDLPGLSPKLRELFMRNKSLDSLMGIHRISSPEEHAQYIREFLEGKNLLDEEKEAFFQEMISTNVERQQTRATLRIPVTYRGNPYGSITLQQCISDRNWTDEEVAVLQEIATQVGTVFYQAQIAEEEQRAKEALQKSFEREHLIRKVVEVIGQSFEIDLILKTVVEQVGQYLDADRASISRYYLDDGKLIVNASAQYTRPGIMPLDNEDLELLIKAMQHLSPEALRAGDVHVLNVSDQETYLGYLRERMTQLVLPGISTERLIDMILKYEVKASLRVNIDYRGIPYGSISISQVTHNREWLPEEVELVKAIAEQAGSAIYQAELYRKEQKAKEEAEKRLQRESLMRRIVEIINESLDVGVIMDTIAQELGQFLQADRAVLMRYNMQNQSLKLLFSAQYCANQAIQPLAKEDIHLILKALQYLSPEVLEENKDRIINMSDMEKEQGQYGQSSTQLQSDGWNPQEAMQLSRKYCVKAILRIGVFYRGVPYGSIALHQCTYREWQQDEIELVSSVADQLGIALSQADLYLAEQQAAQREMVVRRFIQAVHNPIALDDKFQELSNELGRYLDTDHVFITRYDSHKKELQPPTREYRSGEDVPSMLEGDLQSIAKDSAWIMEEMCQSKKPFSFDRDTPGLSPKTKEYLDRQKVQSGLGIAISYNQTCLAILFIHQVRDKRVWSDEEKAIIEAVARQAAIAVTQADLLINEQKARQEAEAANKKKSQFLTNMSHELRTPLNAVIGYSGMMRKGVAGALTEKQEKYARNIEVSGKHLLDMVNDILDVAKIEAGKIQLSFQTVDLGALVQELKDILSGMAEQKKVHLEMHLQSNIDDMIADPARLRQIFFNLISNAIKFNKENGEVHVWLYKDNGWLIGEVADTGIGISNDKQDELFTEFYQVDASTSRSHEGAGLGLALTKRLVELHGGKITVDSKEGIGSSFAFRIPVSPPAELQRD